VTIAAERRPARHRDHGDVVATPITARWFCRKLAPTENQRQIQFMLGVRRSSSKAVGPRRVATGPLPQLPIRALQGPRTLEDRLIPGVFLFAFVGLLAIQVFHALTH
jgi:hypothetical protein